MKLRFTNRQEMPKQVFPNLTNTLKSQITEIQSSVYAVLYALYVLCKLFVNTGEGILQLFFFFFFHVFCAPLICLSLDLNINNTKNVSSIMPIRS